MAEPTTNQERWPRGTPVAPSGRGPGGGRFRGGRHRAGVSVGRILGLDWARQVAAQMTRLQQPDQHGLMTHAEVDAYADRRDYVITGIAGGGYGMVEFRRYSDGRMLAHKTLIQNNPGEPETEVEVSHLGRALGAAVPAVVRVGHNELLMEYIPEPDWAAIAPRGQRFGYRSQMVGEAFDDTDAGRLLRLLDIVINNNDRHAANVRMRPDGVLVGIDHGVAFNSARYYGSPGLATPRTVAAIMGVPRWMIAGPIATDARQIYYSPAALQEARRRLATVQQHIRPTVWAGIEATLDVLEQMTDQTRAVHDLD